MAKVPVYPIFIPDRNPYKRGIPPMYRNQCHPDVVPLFFGGAPKQLKKEISGLAVAAENKIFLTFYSFFYTLIL